MIDTFKNGISFAIVCDGMGGAKGGKTASVTAVNEFSEHISRMTPDMTPEEVHFVFDKAIQSANTDIYEKSKKNKSLQGMGTTLVATVIIDDIAYIINIGDSRCYFLHDDNIERVTRDHSAVQTLVDQGLITESQARNHPNKNIITRALGVENHVEYDIYARKIQPGDIFLLCTDGITNYVDDLEIPFEVINNLETVPNRLIELANSRGGSDNSTVVIIKI